MNLGNFGVDVKENKIEAVEDKKLDVDISKIKQELKIDEIDKYLPWFLKYEINNFDDLIITEEIQKIIDYIQNFKPGKAILLAGSAGSGKTTTLNLLGNHFGYEILELNASDARNKKSIEESVGIAIKQKSLFAKSKLILIDEADGVSGTNDRGGLATISKLIKESTYPIAFTANDKSSEKIKTLKKLCTYIDFENHSQELLLKIAQKILKKENIQYNQKDLEEFIEARNTTDIRGFINDLQASIYNGKFEKDDKLELRDYKKKIEGLLNQIYYSYPEDSLKGAYNTDVNLDELFLYLEENTPNIYAKAALINAFNEIAKADVFRGRIMKWQHWRFLVYINFYLTYGISNSKDTPNKIKTYKRNGRILSKWIYGNKVNSLGVRTKTQKANGEDEKFIEKLAKTYSRSAAKTRTQDLKYFSIIYQNSDEFRKSMDQKFEIDDSTKKALLEL